MSTSHAPSSAAFELPRGKNTRTASRPFIDGNRGQFFMRHSVDGERLIRRLFTNIAGGPGSGKVTHCDTLMQEKRGVTHINMMDLLQQYAIGNGEDCNPWNLLENNYQLKHLFLPPPQNCKTFLSYPREPSPKC